MKSQVLEPIKIIPVTFKSFSIISKEFNEFKEILRINIKNGVSSKKIKKKVVQTLGGKCICSHERPESD